MFFKLKQNMYEENSPLDFEGDKVQPTETVAPMKKKRSNRNITHNWTENEIKKLISAVKLRPIIWNPDHVLYKNRNSNYAAWCEIEERVFGGKIKVSEIITKWGSLRVQYKHTGSKYKDRTFRFGAKIQKKWKYFDAMSFIDLPEKSFTEASAANLEVAAADTDSGASLSSTSLRQPFPTNISTHHLLSNIAHTTSCSTASANMRTVDIEEDGDHFPGVQPAMESLTNDEFMIFGQFVAAEIKRLPTDGHRQRLKRMIQRTIMDYNEKLENEEVSYCHQNLAEVLDYDDNNVQKDFVKIEHDDNAEL